MIVIWLQLLLLAGEVNDNGCVYFRKEVPYTEQLLSIEFDYPIETVRLALSTFVQFGMIEIVDEIIMVSNWDKYQSADRLHEIREYNRLKQQESRERRRLCADVNDMSMTSQLHVNDSSISISHSNNSLSPLEDNKDTGCGEREKKTGKERKAFVKPTIDEIAAYCKERSNGIDPEEFFDKYESNGWVIGKNGNPMKDWKATIRTWERNEKKGVKNNAEHSGNTGKNSNGPRTTYSIRPRFAGHIYDADGNDVTPGT